MSLTASDAIEIETAVGPIAIACVYRSQSLNFHQNDQVTSAIRNLCVGHSPNETIVVGDFNLPEICWVTGTVGGSVEAGGGNLYSSYMNLITELGLSWLITDEVTRRRLVGDVIQESTLDQVFVSNDALVVNHKMLAPLGKSDHMCIKVELNIDIENNVKFRRLEKQNWSKVSKNDLLKAGKAIDWTYSLPNLSAELMWGELHNKLMKLSDTVPVTSIKVNSEGSLVRKLPWDTSALKRIRRKKDKQ